jgi:hypothetical protein
MGTSLALRNLHFPPLLMGVSQLLSMEVESAIHEQINPQVKVWQYINGQVNRIYF